MSREFENVLQMSGSWKGDFLSSVALTYCTHQASLHSSVPSLELPLMPLFQELPVTPPSLPMAAALIPSSVPMLSIPHFCSMVGTLCPPCSRVPKSLPSGRVSVCAIFPQSSLNIRGSVCSPLFPPSITGSPSLSPSCQGTTWQPFPPLLLA